MNWVFERYLILKKIIKNNPRSIKKIVTINHFLRAVRSSQEFSEFSRRTDTFASTLLYLCIGWSPGIN